MKSRKKRNKETLKGINIRVLFGMNLRRLRTIANLSQIDLAAKANLAPNFINDIENGKKWVSTESLGRLASALEAEPYQFFLSDPQWNNRGAELFSLYLNDIEDTFSKIGEEYRRRYLPENLNNGKK